MIRPKLTRFSIKPVLSRRMTVMQPKGYCYACGDFGNWSPAIIINDELARTWQINNVLRRSFDARESMYCQSCECSFRLRQLAECLSYVYNGSPLSELVTNGEFKKLKVAEINSCGKLHQILKKLPNLYYSEYGSKDGSVRSENLEKLSYQNDFFDLVLTSDTLEHIPDIERALKEIRRVLRPGGMHIFTVPIIWNRQTNNRSLQDPSYHGAGEPDYLVFNEFGHDIINTIIKCGFRVKVYKPNLLNLNDVAGVIVATKREGN